MCNQITQQPQLNIDKVVRNRFVYLYLDIWTSDQNWRTIKVSIFKSPRYHYADTNFLNLVKGISFNDVTPNV